MRLTLTLYKQPIRWLLKQKWKQKGVVFDYPPSIPEPIIERGVEVVDAQKVYSQEERPGPPEEFVTPDHPLFDPPETPQDHPDYHENYIYTFSHRTRLLEGEQQARILTKTQLFRQLPPGVSDLIGRVNIPNQDLLVQRYILQSNIWDTTKDKLPKRFNNQIPGWKFKSEFGIPRGKSTQKLLQNLIRLCMSLGGAYPDLVLTRSLVDWPYLRANFTYNETPVQIQGCNQLLIESQRPLPAMAGHDIVDESVIHHLPDIYPVSPMIDLKREHIYHTDDSTGWDPRRQLRHPHTLFINNVDFWDTSQRNAKILMYMFGYALTSARQRFGVDVTTLPEPVCVQCVSSDGATFHLACFQLNTLDLISPSGPKNLAWFDNDNLMYFKEVPKRAMLRNTRYLDYDPQVVQKLLALCLHGADLSQRSWPHIEGSGGEEHRVTETL